jgi:FkbM family methyltransferase
MTVFFIRLEVYAITDIRDILGRLPTAWESLKNCGKPILIYGMGNGADKMFALCGSHGITVTDVFASDGYVRGHTFRGYRVKTLSEAERLYGSFAVILAFGFRGEEMFRQFAALCERHEVFTPDTPVYGDTAVDRDFIDRYHGELNEVYNMLSCEFSKQLYTDVISYKLSGNPDYVSRITTERKTALDWLELSSRERYADLGAYNGDTVEELYNYAGGFGSITAFEPDRKNFDKLQKKIAAMGLYSITEAHNLSAWKEKACVGFSGNSGRGSSIANGGGAMLNADALDNILNGEAVTFIKYDVEGSEYEAVLGSMNAIKRYSPKLIVSLYHRSEDIFRLPLLVRAINPGYQFCLGRHKYIPAWDFNLYAKKS